MKARRIILFANGREKAKAVEKAIRGDVRPDTPASIFQFHHDVTMLIARSCAENLETCELHGE